MREKATEAARWPIIWLPLARRVWLGLALTLFAFFVASIPVAYQASLILCTTVDPLHCSNGQLTPDNVQALAQLGLSVAAYEGFLVALQVAGSLLCWVIGTLIFWRMSREWIGLFFSLLLIVVGATQLAGLVAGIDVNASTPRLLQFLVPTSSVLNVVLGAAGAALLVTFPTGRLIPRWSAVLILLSVVDNALPPSPIPAVSAIEGTAWLLTWVGMLGVQVYRYRRVYDAIQRQQTKWFVFALVVSLSTFVVAFGPLSVVPSAREPNSWYQLVSIAVATLPQVLLPASVGIAVLRYRLWDIDVVINRTLVYGSLTALLVGLYIGLIFALQTLVRILTGRLSQEPLVLVASTLAIAALVQPLRHRLQTTIDERFYRRKYDAAQVVASFSSTLRQEVDLDELREQLVAVVHETMQPTRVLVWLRPTDGARSHAKAIQSTFEVDRNLTPSVAAATPLHRPTTP